MSKYSKTKAVKVLGIDLAKERFQLHGVDGNGHVVLRKRLRRRELMAWMANIPPCLIGMEACGGSHHWARKFREMGHEVRLMSPQFVKPYVKSNKNDMADAEEICEAVQRPNMRFSFSGDYPATNGGGGQAALGFFMCLPRSLLRLRRPVGAAHRAGKLPPA